MVSEAHLKTHTHTQSTSLEPSMAYLSVLLTVQGVLNLVFTAWDILFNGKDKALEDNLFLSIFILCDQVPQFD